MRRSMAYGLGLLLSITTLAAGCEEQETAGPETGADVEDVTADERALSEDEYGLAEGNQIGELEGDGVIGETVTVSADVDRIVQPGTAFAIGGDVVEGGLLIVMPPDMTDVPQLQVGMPIQVVGTVIDFAVPRVETEHRLELDDDIYDEWEDKNALVAQTIRRAPAEEGGEATE